MPIDDQLNQQRAVLVLISEEIDTLKRLKNTVDLRRAYRIKKNIETEIAMLEDQT